MSVYFVLSVFVFVVQSNGQLAPFITPCKSGDFECMKSSAQKAVPYLGAGVPELGISPLDPMKVDRVRANQAGLILEFRDTVVKGLRNCEILQLKRHGLKTNLELKCSPTLVGDYTIGGRLLVMPIEGKGKYKIKIRDIIVKITLETPERVVDGETYWNLDKWDFSSDVKTGVIFQFQNLFNGNKQLSDAVHQFANSNWRDIYREVAPPIIKAIVTEIVNEIKKLFNKVPLNQLVIQ